MADAERLSILETPTQVRQWDIIRDGGSLARLYCEVVAAGASGARATCRLHFDGDVRPEVMRQVVDGVTREVLAGLPRGVCTVYRGHVVSSFEYGV